MLSTRIYSTFPLQIRGRVYKKKDEGYQCHLSEPVRPKLINTVILKIYLSPFLLPPSHLPWRWDQVPNSSKDPAWLGLHLQLYESLPSLPPLLHPAWLLHCLYQHIHCQLLANPLCLPPCIYTWETAQEENEVGIWWEATLVKIIVFCIFEHFLMELLWWT